MLHFVVFGTYKPQWHFVRETACVEALVNASDAAASLALVNASDVAAAYL